MTTHCPKPQGGFPVILPFIAYSEAKAKTRGEGPILRPIEASRSRRDAVRPRPFREHGSGPKKPCPPKRLVLTESTRYGKVQRKEKTLRYREDNAVTGRKDRTMSRTCQFCGKTPHVGHNVSHANNKTKKVWYPNLQRVRHVHADGTIRRVRACTRCIRSGMVVKPA